MDTIFNPDNKAKKTILSYKESFVLNLVCLIIVLFTLTGCQSTGLYLANAANNEDGYISRNNITYGNETWQKMDIYYPEYSDTASPAIVFYYGGSWRKGDKEDYAFVANRFTREGYIVIIPDYVKYPSAVYPAFVEDAAAVSHWIASHASEYSIDISRLHLMGHSAGAHTGMMLLTDESYLAKYALGPEFYQCFIGIAGPYDFVPGSRYYRKIFGPEERFPLMQATNYIDGSEPPMFLLTAGLDWLVADSNTEKVLEAVQQSGGQILTKTYPALGHMTIIGSLSDSLPIGSDVSNDILAFINNLEKVDDLSLAPSEQSSQFR